MDLQRCILAALMLFLLPGLARAQTGDPPPGAEDVPRVCFLDQPGGPCDVRIITELSLLSGVLGTLEGGLAVHLAEAHAVGLTAILMDGPGVAARYRFRTGGRVSYNVGAGISWSRSLPRDPDDRDTRVHVSAAAMFGPGLIGPAVLARTGPEAGGAAGIRFGGPAGLVLGGLLLLAVWGMSGA